MSYAYHLYHLYPQSQLMMASRALYLKLGQPCAVAGTPHSKAHVLFIAATRALTGPCPVLKPSSGSVAGGCTEFEVKLVEPAVSFEA